MPRFTHLHSSPLVQLSATGAPVAVDLLDVQTEVRVLKQCLAESGKKASWRSECATCQSFCASLSYGCQVLHLTGHGLEGKVIFENAKGQAHILTSEELQQLLLAGGKGIRVVFVSTCHSESIGRIFAAAGETCGDPVRYPAIRYPHPLYRAPVRPPACPPARAGIPHVVAIRNSQKVLDQASQVTLIDPSHPPPLPAPPIAR
jgi:hypothetical protein